MGFGGSRVPIFKLEPPILASNSPRDRWTGCGPESAPAAENEGDVVPGRGVTGGASSGACTQHDEKLGEEEATKRRSHS